MKIAHLDLGYRPVLLAPMEDVTDLPFRRRCREFGASMVYTEFVSADALIRNVNSTIKKMAIAPEERPAVIQLYGRDAETMAQAAQIAASFAPDLIDLNFGCPVKRVAGKGAGSGLLQDVPRLLEITHAVVKAVNIPVSVKTRLGWDCNNIIIEDLAERLQDQGIVALTIHGRTRSQMYKGSANWEPIQRVCANPKIQIPIIGNGDIITGTDTLQAFDNFGVDAVMIGRGAIGRPWVFEHIRAILDGKPAPTHPYKWYLSLFQNMVQESVERSGELGGILHMRRHLAATPIFKGIPDFRNHRIALLRATTINELLDLLWVIPEKFDLSELPLSSGF